MASWLVAQKRKKLSRRTWTFAIYRFSISFTVCFCTFVAIPVLISCFDVFYWQKISLIKQARFCNTIASVTFDWHHSSGDQRLQRKSSQPAKQNKAPNVALRMKPARQSIALCMRKVALEKSWVDSERRSKDLPGGFREKTKVTHWNYFSWRSANFCGAVNNC